jgi:hypothetical protein
MSIGINEALTLCLIQNGDEAKLLKEKRNSTKFYDLMYLKKYCT